MLAESRAKAGIRLGALWRACARAGTGIGDDIQRIGADPRRIRGGSSCLRLPDATNTGVPGRVFLRSVPGQVSSGPGWRYNPAEREVDVTGEGAVLSGLSIRCNVNISAAKVTITDDRVVTGGSFGISLRNAAVVTIDHSTIVA